MRLVDATTNAIGSNDAAEETAPAALPAPADQDAAAPAATEPSTDAAASADEEMNGQEPSGNADGPRPAQTEVAPAVIPEAD